MLPSNKLPPTWHLSALFLCLAAALNCFVLSSSLTAALTESHPMQSSFLRLSWCLWIKSLDRKQYISLKGGWVAFSNLVMIQFKMGFKLHSCFNFVSFITSTGNNFHCSTFWVLAHMLGLVNNVYMRQPETLLFSFACTMNMNTCFRLD